MNINNTSFYNYHPLLNNTFSFCKKISETFSPLQSQDKTTECILRISRIIISPFKCLTFTMGYVFDLSWKNKHRQQLMKLKPKGNVVDKKLWEKRIRLFSLVKRMPSYSSYWKKNRIQKILEEPNILDQLKIDLPLKEIEEIFNEFSIIVLRKPKKENLLFYCGNHTIYSSAMKHDYIKENSSHEHKEYDTVDCDLLMNPTIVSNSLSNKKLENYLSSIGKKYKKIEGCVMSVIHNADVLITPTWMCTYLMKKRISVLNSICDDEKGVVINAFDIHDNINIPYTKEIKKIAKNYNFTTKNVMKLIRDNHGTKKTSKKYIVEIDFHRPKSKEIESQGKITKCTLRIIRTLISPLACLIFPIRYAFDFYRRYNYSRLLMKLQLENIPAYRLQDAIENIFPDYKLRDEKKDKLFSLVKRMPHYRLSWKNHRINKILENPHILNQLKIELPINEIEKIFNEFGIIVLRKPKKDKLLFYCGNYPRYSSAMKYDYANQNDFHAHKNCDTVDCDFLMNPTIVSASLDKGLIRYLSSIDKKYKKIEGCVMSVIHSTDVHDYRIDGISMSLMEKKIGVLNSICDDKEGKVIDAFSFGKNKKDKKCIAEIGKIAEYYNFKTKTRETQGIYHDTFKNKDYPYFSFEIDFHRPRFEEKIKSL